MFQDESIFGRINNIVKCWVLKKQKRPTVIKQLVREFRYLFGAVDPLTGDSCFRILTHCDTVCMNTYLSELSNEFIDDYRERLKTS
jgi:demethoxyubiquinone hydroxylase (CLK1/Coq7/Cat5 family)